MLIDEAAAKLKFCPFGRGAMPLGKDSAKFASCLRKLRGGVMTDIRFCAYLCVLELEAIAALCLEVFA